MADSLYCVYKRPDIAVFDLAQICNDYDDNGDIDLMETDHIWQDKFRKIIIDINAPIDVIKLTKPKHYLSENVPCLLIACTYSKAQMVDYILSLNADPRAVDDLKNTALHECCRSKIDVCEKISTMLSIDKSLLARPNRNGTLPIHIVMLQDTTGPLEYLACHYKDNINYSTKKGLTPLHVCAGLGNVEKMAVLLRHPCIEINARDSSGDTPAHHAAANRKFDIFLLLHKDDRICKGIRNGIGETAADNLPKDLLLLYAAQFYDYNKFENLFYKVKESCVDKKHNNILHYVCKGNTDIKQKIDRIHEKQPLLLRKRNSDGDLPLHTASSNIGKHVLSHLIRKYPVNVNTPNKSGMTALHMAVSDQIPANVRLLLTHPHIDVNAQNNDGDTPSHLAAREEDLDTLAMLRLHPNYKVGVVNKQFRNADEVNPLNKVLLLFASLHKFGFVENCLKRGALFITDNNKNTVLHLACNSHVDAVRKVMLFLKSDASLLIQQNNDGICPLHLVAESGNINVFQALLSNSACDVNIRDRTGKTPLHYAVTSQHTHIVDCLVGNIDIDINAQDDENNTAGHIVSKRRNKTVYASLKRHPRFDKNVRNLSNQPIWNPDAELEELTKYSWNEYKRMKTPVSMAYYSSITLIQGKLYYCKKDSGVMIYNEDLEEVDQITGRMIRVRQVAEMTSGDLIAAAQNGLYHLASSGAAKQVLSEKSYSSVKIHNDVVFAARNASSTSVVFCVELYNHVTDRWQMTRSITQPCTDSRVVTVCVTDPFIYACCYFEHQIYVLSYEGVLIKTIGNECLEDPFLCHSDGDGALLVADEAHHRLQVLTSEHQWSVVETTPQLYYVTGAVYVSGRLYVLYGPINRHFLLSLFLPEL